MVKYNKLSFVMHDIISIIITNWKRKSAVLSRMLQINPFKYELQPCMVQFSRFADCEMPSLKPFPEQTVSGSVPHENPHLVTTLIEKHKQMAAERIVVQQRFNTTGKPIIRAAQIHRLTADKYPYRR